MNDYQITALAREYAEWICPYKDKSANLSILDIREAERLINFLLRRYCLVDKETIRKEYKQTAEDYDPYDPMYSNREKLDLLESLFPEIAKEVEG